MKPVLQFEKNENPSVTNLIVLSDGPTAQYPCKENFHLTTKVPLEIGYQTVNWNFTEAGHGKGSPDGIRAVIKRTADRAVAHGNDVLDAKGLHDILTGAEIAVKLFLIDDDGIDQYDSYIKSQNLKTINGTMKIHQVFSSTFDQIFHRAVSCFCSTPPTCQCYEPQMVSENQGPEEVHTQEQQEQTRHSTPLEKPDIDQSIKDEYCVVLYDENEKPYPGVIVDTDEGEVEVQVMHYIGKNRFFWPLISDVLWYKKEQFLTIIEPPEKVARRHFQINENVWGKLENYLDQNTMC